MSFPSFFAFPQPSGGSRVTRVLPGLSRRSPALATGLMLAVAPAAALVSMTCVYLSLPFEATFILFLAVALLCEMLRTLILVIDNTAAVTVICPQPLKI